MYFKSKSYFIAALQFRRDNIDKLVDFFPKSTIINIAKQSYIDNFTCVINLVNGNSLFLEEGDYIILEDNSRYSVIKNCDFDGRFEETEEEPDVPIEIPQDPVDPEPEPILEVVEESAGSQVEELSDEESRINKAEPVVEDEPAAQDRNPSEGITE